MLLSEQLSDTHGGGRIAVVCARNVHGPGRVLFFMATLLLDSSFSAKLS